VLIHAVSFLRRKKSYRSPTSQMTPMDLLEITESGIAFARGHGRPIVLAKQESWDIGSLLPKLLAFLAQTRDEGFRCARYQDAQEELSAQKIIMDVHFPQVVDAALARGFVVLESTDVDHLSASTPSPPEKTSSGSGSVGAHLVAPPSESIKAHNGPHPAPDTPTDLAPIVNFMRAGNPHVSRRHLRNVFKRDADAPYPKTSRAINMAIDRVCALGILLSGGPEGEEWVRLPEHGQDSPDCALCQQGR
jgi:hypothetical protein